MNSMQDRARAILHQMLWLIPAALVGVISGSTFRGALLLAILLLLGLLVSTGTLSALDLVIITAPLMFYASATGRLHLAASDFIFPFVLIYALARGNFHVAWKAARPLIRYSAVVACLLAFSVVYTSLRDAQFHLDLGLTNSMKLIVGLAYAIVVSVLVALSDVRATLRSLRVWTWVATFMSVGSVLTEMGLAPLIPSDGVRSLGFFQDPNLYAGYLLLSFTIIVLGEALRPQRTTVLQLAIVAAGVIVTGSRGAVATLGLLILVAGARIAIKRIRVALAWVGVAAALLAVTLVYRPSAVPAIPALGRLVQSTQAVDADPRLGLWARAISLWESNVVVGVGIGQFGRFSTDVYGSLSSDGTVGYIAHNSLLSFLAELGLVGFSLAVLGLLWLTRRVQHSYSFSLNVRRSLNLGLLSVVAEMMTLNLQNVRYVWLYIGIVVGVTALGRQAVNEGRQQERKQEEHLYCDGGLLPTGPGKSFPVTDGSVRARSQGDSTVGHTPART